MTITKDQAQMLATLAAACRPTGARRWDTAGIMASLAKLHDRDLAEVALATIRAAADRDADTPGVIPTNGNHWREQLKSTFVPNTAPLGSRCTICGLAKHINHHDHAFSLPQPKPAPDVIHGAVQALKAEIAETPAREPATDQGLEAFADKNPELRARVDKLRETLPMPASREPETTTEDGEVSA